MSQTVQTYLKFSELILKAQKSKYVFPHTAFESKGFLQKMSQANLILQDSCHCAPENLPPPNPMSEPKNQDIWWCCAAVIALVI